MTAQRFGGAHSPGATKRSAWANRAPRRGSLRATLLYVFPSFLPLAALFTGSLMESAQLLMSWGVLMAGAGATREGVKAARAYEARAVASPPAIPRKLIGAALTGLGVGLTAFTGDSSIMESGLWTAVAGGLHLGAFGLDPMRAKGLNGLEGEALDRAVTKLETARRLVGEMIEAAESTGDAEIVTRVRRLADSAEATLEKLEREPQEMNRARRFLAVYLVGARDATVRYSQHVSELEDAEARARYVALLVDLERQFDAPRLAIEEKRQVALDVEIDVLRERLRMEGV